MKIEQVQTYKRLVYDAKMLAVEIEALRDEFTLACQPSYFPGMSFDGIPNCSMASDRTGNTASRLADNTIPEDAQQLQLLISEKEKALAAKKRDIQIIDIWLSLLPERENWVVTNHIIENIPWHLVVYRYRSVYGESISIDSLKRMQRKAFEKG